jgi:NADH-quinone oxidoreductase subunit I
VDCITIQATEREDGRHYPEAFRINFNRCIFCGLCAEACPTLALQMSRDFEMAETDGRRLIDEKDRLLVPHGGKYPDYSFWEEAGTAVTHALGHGRQDPPPSDPRSNLP